MTKISIRPGAAGFTIVELVTVVLLLGTLSVVAFSRIVGRDDSLGPCRSDAGWSTATGTSCFVDRDGRRIHLGIGVGAMVTNEIVDSI